MDEAADSSPVAWDLDGTPRSRLFGDIYFTPDDGLAETEAVFLNGCDLPGAWANRDSFTVAELGFGTGLNIAAVLDLWDRTAPATARLNIFSIEAYPLSAEDAGRALGAWPRIAEAARALLDRWPSPAKGFQRIDLPRYRASLDLAVMEAGQALQAWSGQADAWFLDGFSPASNPQMWRDEVLALVAARSAPGARLATFTVAGAVRRGLAANGFAVEKRPGHGRKRERLEARLPGATATPPPPHVAVIGAGIAGAALARAFRALGARVDVIDHTDPAAGASGNPAALVSPGLDASGGPVTNFYAQAYARALDLYEQTSPAAVIAKGAARPESHERDARRFDQVARQEAFAPGVLCRAGADEVSALIGEPAPAGLVLPTALVIEPAAALAAWIGEDPLRARVERVERTDDGWRLDFEGRPPMRADVVVVAAGWESTALLPHLPLQPVRGQASWADLEPPPAASVRGAYAIPTRQGLLFGATHDRDRTDLEVLDQDHDRNLAALAAARPGLAARLTGARLEGRASIRAATPDRLPLAGLDPASGLWVLSGLGSRGFATAPLLAEHMAALALGRPSPLPRDLWKLIAPERFNGRFR